MPLATAAMDTWADPREFREVYRDHHGFVWHSLHRFGLHGAGLEDALQDVFVVAYRRRETFSGSAKAWLYAIARRVASNHRRSLRRRDARADAMSQVETSLRTPVPEAVVALDRYLARLSDEDRELFVLSEVEGMTGPEIAAAWDRNLNTVYTRIRKLRASLREEAVVQQVRRSRPEASAHAWAALIPSLQSGAVLMASGLGAGWVAGIAAVGLGAVALVGAGFGAASQEPTASPEPIVASLSPPGRMQAPQRDPAPALEESSTPQPTSRAAPAAVVVAQPVSNRSRPAVVSPVSVLDEETAILQRARAALRQGDGKAVLRHTAEHATRFPGGALTSVRSILRIEALCTLDKQPQARAEAKILLRDNPSMTSRRRLEKSCAVAPQKRSHPDMTGP